MLKVCNFFFHLFIYNLYLYKKYKLLDILYNYYKNFSIILHYNLSMIVDLIEAVKTK